MRRTFSLTGTISKSPHREDVRGEYHGKRWRRNPRGGPGPRPHLFRERSQRYSPAL